MTCPLRLSYKTVDSYIGKLRAICHAIGRDGEWDKRLGLGNLAADRVVKDYLRLVTTEKLRARITPQQASPFFVDKLAELLLLNALFRRGTRHISRRSFSVATDLVIWAK